jgi:UDP-N-acetylmuramate: L-alanyl-gamma-D-glutamyl-meso-diaminopimelate ligase
VAVVNWQQTGLHNVLNAVAAIAASATVGLSVKTACAALSEFVGVKRRMEVIYQDGEVTVYDDFAHHPTAIKTTLEGLRAKVGGEKIIAIVEPRSATMKMGVHQGILSGAVNAADQALWYKSAAVSWDIESVAQGCDIPAAVCDDIEQLLASTIAQFSETETAHIVIMSNGGFEGFHKRLVAALQ